MLLVNQQSQLPKLHSRAQAQNSLQYGIQPENMSGKRGRGGRGGRGGGSSKGLSEEFTIFVSKIFDAFEAGEMHGAATPRRVGGHRAVGTCASRVLRCRGGVPVRPEQRRAQVHPQPSASLGARVEERGVSALSSIRDASWFAL
jgi:hypothetical protein